MHDILFYIFAGVAVFSALMVILAKNPVRSVLNLILTFFSTAATWLMLEAEFLAITLILVYVGAVMVLFLFVVMMLDVEFVALKAKFTKWLPIGITMSLALLLVLVNIIDKDNFLIADDSASLAYSYGVSNVKIIGQLIFTRYLLHFEIAGVLLLVAIIAAIGLIYKGPRDRKIQDVAKQIKAKRNVTLLDI